MIPGIRSHKGLVDAHIAFSGSNPKLLEFISIFLYVIQLMEKILQES